MQIQREVFAQVRCIGKEKTYEDYKFTVKLQLEMLNL